MKKIIVCFFALCATPIVGINIGKDAPAKSTQKVYDIYGPSGFIGKISLEKGSVSIIKISTAASLLIGKEANSSSVSPEEYKKLSLQSTPKPISNHNEFIFNAIQHIKNIFVNASDDWRWDYISLNPFFHQTYDGIFLLQSSHSGADVYALHTPFGLISLGHTGNYKKEKRIHIKGTLFASLIVQLKKSDVHRHTFTLTNVYAVRAIGTTYLPQPTYKEYKDFINGEAVYATFKKLENSCPDKKSI